MKILKPREHGIIDYAWAGAMIAAPWLFGFSKNKEATLASISTGAGILGLSLMTRYPLGAVKLISFPVHGVIETVAGLSTAASPWLCGYSENKSARLTHLISGLGTLAVVAMTDYAAAESGNVKRRQFQPGERGAGLAEQMRDQPQRERETVDLGPPTEIPAAKKAGFSQV